MTNKHTACLEYDGTVSQIVHDDESCPNWQRRQNHTYHDAPGRAAKVALVETMPDLTFLRTRVFNRLAGIHSHNYDNIAT